MDTVEAIQVFLPDIGWILYPGVPENSPTEITDEEIAKLDPRVFDAPNLNGPTFIYVRDEPRRLWFR